jgi:hypothetical protein
MEALPIFTAKGSERSRRERKEKGKSARAREGMDILPPKGRRLVFKTKVMGRCEGYKGIREDISSLGCPFETIKVKEICFLISGREE